MFLLIWNILPGVSIPHMPNSNKKAPRSCFGGGVAMLALVFTQNALELKYEA
jgi:hypothetical protein